MIIHQMLEFQGTIFSETPIYIKAYIVYIIYISICIIVYISLLHEGDPKYIQLTPPQIALLS